ncbi:Peroxisomal NUDIX hydrolase protein [Dioscorea alata]|uniref:Peroxisomal NUDIX hydrolase protein n=1 Tax=Dioscorea alata TaxID=55571 RepID=A0ACB7W3T2_DIOAL|nr:Peroxisomal NUDIX hydrolase protein [Dioscorea alata]
MRAALRKVSTMATGTPNPIGLSPRLASIVQQLRLYKPSSPPTDDEDAVEEMDARGKIFSQLGLAESSAPCHLEKLPPRRAAVLICLFEDDVGDLRVILTKRSSNLSSHSGEVSLPGGKTEEADVDDADTATREAKEEIGLDPSLITVVTVLEPYISKHLLRVAPVISILTDKQAFKPVLNTDEVEVIFDAPLEMFLKDENHRSEEREWLGVKYLIHFFDYETKDNKFVIWGLTAFILIRAASVVYQRSPSFPEQNPRFMLPSPTSGTCSI